MTEDIVVRLRSACPTARDNTEELHNRRLLNEAADEIERLRAAVAALQASEKFWRQKHRAATFHEDMGR